MCAGEEVRALHPQSEPETQMLCQCHWMFTFAYQYVRVLYLIYENKIIISVFKSFSIKIP